jgi:CMP-N-acetylneuraminic acid synthetase/quercetin dioxygenase-like cupin family protein
VKRIALIPILLGSSRIPDKNLVLVDGYPMVFYAVRACQQSGVFDEIYINSEHEIFEPIARMLDVKFYQRRPESGGSMCTMSNKSRQCSRTRCQTHDHFLSDFMQSVQSTYLALVHTTSPLLRPETIRDFVRFLEDGGYDSLFSIEERFTETLFKGQPLNFSLSKKIPTQTLSPLQMITWALSGWKVTSFLESYKRDDPEENGPTFCGKTGVFPLDRIQALDADSWDDLYLIEASLQHRRQKISSCSYLLPKDFTGIENNLRDLIARDGVTKFEGKGANSRLSNLEDIKRRMGEPPWLYLLVYTGSDQIALICQPPGEGARKHCHVTHDEWWLVLEGTFEWRLGDGQVVQAKESNVVFLPRGTVHSIVCTSEKPGMRLACGAHDMEHIYVR